MSKRVIFVCSMFLLISLMSAWTIMKSLMAGRPYFDIGILFLLPSIGLFLGSARSRTTANWVINLHYLLFAIIAGVMLWPGGSGTHDLPGTAGRLFASPAFILVYGLTYGAVLALLQWMMFSAPFDEHVGRSSGKI